MATRQRHAKRPASKQTAAEPDVVAHEGAPVTPEDIACRAHELYERRGREPGHDWEDWFEAERELRRPQ